MGGLELSVQVFMVLGVHNFNMFNEWICRGG